MAMDAADDCEAYEDRIGQLTAAIRAIADAPGGAEALRVAINAAVAVAEETFCRPTCTGTYDADGPPCEVDCACPCKHGLIGYAECVNCDQVIHQEPVVDDTVEGGVAVVWVHDPTGEERCHLMCMHCGLPIFRQYLSRIPFADYSLHNGQPFHWSHGGRGEDGADPYTACSGPSAPLTTRQVGFTTGATPTDLVATPRRRIEAIAEDHASQFPELLDEAPPTPGL